MRKLLNKKGFTLMEMLIVVAIIAILVAIAIPTFSGQLEKAKLAADKANVRAAYAEATVAYLENTMSNTSKAYTCGGVACTACEGDGSAAMGTSTPGSNVKPAKGEIYLKVESGLQAKTDANKIGFYYDGTFYTSAGAEIK